MKSPERRSARRVASGASGDVIEDVGNAMKKQALIATSVVRDQGRRSRLDLANRGRCEADRLRRTMAWLPTRPGASRGHP
jgi:hypothetical protein